MKDQIDSTVRRSTDMIKTIKVCLIAGSWIRMNSIKPVWGVDDMLTTCWAPTSNPVSTVMEPKLLASNLICDAAVLQAAWRIACGAWKLWTALLPRPLQQAKPHMPELALGPSSYAGIAVHLREGREKAMTPTSIRFLKLRIGTRSGDRPEEYRVCSLSPQFANNNLQEVSTVKLSVDLAVHENHSASNQPILSPQNEIHSCKPGLYGVILLGLCIWGPILDVLHLRKMGLIPSPYYY